MRSAGQPGLKCSEESDLSVRGTMETAFSRRNFVRSGALAAAACAASTRFTGTAQARRREQRSPVRLGLASYTFRNFTAHR